MHMTCLPNICMEQEIAILLASINIFTYFNN